MITSIVWTENIYNMCKNNSNNKIDDHRLLQLNCGVAMQGVHHVLRLI